MGSCEYFQVSPPRSRGILGDAPREFQKGILGEFPEESAPKKYAEGSCRACCTDDNLQNKYYNEVYLSVVWDHSQIQYGFQQVDRYQVNPDRISQVGIVENCVSGVDSELIEAITLREPVIIQSHIKRKTQKEILDSLPSCSSGISY